MIDIDYTRDELLSEPAKQLLKDYYMLPTETSPQEAFARAAEAFCFGDYKLAQRIYDYASKQYFMFSSPILSNAPKYGEQSKSMPISCFLLFIDDTLDSIIDHSTELRWLSIAGGGVGGHWSSVRTVSDKAPGPIPFLHTVDADMTAYRQGKTRKGSYAAYLDVSHPDIIEFIHMRVPTGDVNRKNLNLHHGVNITDAFMQAVEHGDNWELRDPHTHESVETVSARELWQQILEIRYRTGEPYLFFIDTAKQALPPEQKELGLDIHGSNLCIEITLPVNTERTAVCCLSSLNLEKIDEWENTTIVEDLTEFLDNVISYFVEHAPDCMSKAKFSAYRERSIGIGAMGWHSLLQKKGLAMDSADAMILNEKIFKRIKEKAKQKSIELAEQKGACPDMVKTGRRNANLLAIAPNANSSMIVGTSPSIEPIRANAYTQRTRIGSTLIKNKYLEKCLQKYNLDKEQVWSSIITNNGSVQHIDQLTAEEKNVFKTATELDMKYIIKQAAERQKYICQSQSLNLFFPPNLERKILHDVHFSAWKQGCKSLYYLRTETGNKAEKVSEKIKRNALVDYEKDEECVSCQA